MGVLLGKFWWGTILRRGDVARRYSVGNVEEVGGLEQGGIASRPFILPLLLSIELPTKHVSWGLHPKLPSLRTHSEMITQSPAGGSVNCTSKLEFDGQSDSSPNPSVEIKSVGWTTHP